MHGFTRTPYHRSSLAAAGGLHGRQTSPRLSGRRSRDQAGACCTAQAVWHITEQAHCPALNRGCQGGHAGPTPPSARHQGTAREFVKGNSCRGVRCGAIHIMSWGRSETIPQLGVKFRVTPDSGADASLRGGPTTPHHGVYKRRIAKPSSRSLTCWISTPPSPPIRLRLRLLLPFAFDSAFSTHSLLTLPSSPAHDRLRLRLHFSALLRPHVADSTHPPGPVSHSAHSLSTPPSRPKSLPSRLTVASHSLDRR